MWAAAIESPFSYGTQKGAMNNKNVILIGMPGVGKTTIGKRLATMSGLGFIDTDRIIEKEAGARIATLLSTHGSSGFMQIEERICVSLDAEYSVIATGGSVVYGEAAMEHLHSLGTIVYLQLGLGALSSRLGDLSARGVVLPEGKTLEALYAERVPLYQKWADIVIDESSSFPAQTTRRLYHELRSRGFFRGMGHLDPKKKTTTENK